MNVLSVVGARPNFMKIAPIHRVLDARGHGHTLVHTGQHYDANMSRVFFDELGIPRPDINLGVGSGSHAEQTGRVMIAIEAVLLEQRPDVVVVVGDVNSTMAATVVAVKLGIAVAHVEAGLRSFDREMPEELNRLVTDQLADLLLTPSADANENLTREGIPAERIRLVGNVMIDTLQRHLPAARARKTAQRLGLPERYAVLTMHRPSNVDQARTLGALLDVLVDIAGELPVVFPVHPRTVAKFDEFGLGDRLGGATGLTTVEPLGYLDFLGLMAGATLALTDSGGIQEETTVLGVPCLTLRENTERPVTVTMGTNQIVGTDPARIRSAARAALNGGRPADSRVPPLWDGHAAERVVDALERFNHARATR